MVSLAEIAGQVTNGLILGLILAVVSIGFTTVLGVMGVINFAHGLLFALGAYLFVSLVPKVGFGIALVAAPMIVALIGHLLELALIKRLYGKDPLLVLVLTFGVALAGEDAIQLIWGKVGYSVSAPAMFSGAVDLGFLIYSKYRLIMGGFALAIILALWAFLEKTPFGAIIRAGSIDPEMVSLLGKNLGRVRSMVFALAAALAAIAGIIASPLWSIRPTMGLDALLPAFLIVVIGGLGSFWGTVIAALLVGFLNSMSVMIIPRFADLTMYVLAAAVVLYRPRGLMGRRSVLE